MHPPTLTMLHGIMTLAALSTLLERAWRVDALVLVCCSQLLADTFNGGQLSCMALAMAREPTAFRSLRIRPGAILTDPGALLARLLRGWLASACVPLARATARPSTI